MVLKRKRSASELLSSPSSASTFSFGSSPPPHNPFTTDAAPAHLPSRTLKRFRDSRPSDAEVHRKFYEWRAHHRETLNSCAVSADRTLSLLYSAQQQAPQAPVLEQAASALAAPTASSQQSLHRFWNINSTPTSSVGSSPALEQQMVTAAPSACDDCGAGLGDGGDGMDIDGCGFEDHACGACGKNVCFSCSVSNLGEQKRCLQCAGRRVWVGGIGWTNVAVSAC